MAGNITDEVWNNMPIEDKIDCLRKGLEELVESMNQNFTNVESARKILWGDVHKLWGKMDTLLEKP